MIKTILSKIVLFGLLRAYDFTLFAVARWDVEARRFISDIGRRLRDRGCRADSSGSCLVQGYRLPFGEAMLQASWAPLLRVR